MILTELIEVLGQFEHEGSLISIEKLGAGHINTTYLIVTDKNKYVLQKINTAVFSDVDGLMNNMRYVTEHMAAAQNTACRLKLTAEGAVYVKYKGGFYRMYDYVDGVSIVAAATSKDMYLTGLAFGAFQKAMEDFSQPLVETIPNFHNTEKRYYDFEKAVAADKGERGKSCNKEIAAYIELRYLCGVINSKLGGEVPVRVTHNDTKINNVIFNAERTVPLSVIDLDTVMPGSLLYDFGDAVRSGCNAGAEDEEDLTKVYCENSFFRALCQGFFTGARDILTAGEKDLLALSGAVLTYECGLRFLTDYLNGDVYFRVHKDGHNLLRARCQLKLAQDIIEKLPDLERIVKEELEAV